MPIDPNIVLGIRNPQEVALGYEKLVAAQQQNKADQQAQQTQNQLRQLLAQPDAIDTSTGLPSVNTLAKISRIDPATGAKLAGEVSQIQERKAQQEHVTSETVAARQKANTEALSESLALYDADIKSGNVSPEIADQNMRKRLRDHIYGQAVSEGEKEKLWGELAAMPAEKLRVLATSAQQRQAQEKFKQEEADKAAAAAERLRHDKALEGNAAKRLEAESAPTELDDAGIQYAADLLRDKGTMPPLGMGKSAAKMRQQIIERAARDAAAEGSGASGDVARAASTKADTASLSNITKIADSASAYEETAKKNFDLAMRLAKKGIPTNMGPWMNRWIQDGETALGDPNIPPYAAALLTGANEYAKVMSGSTGSQGSTVDSRKEAAAMFAKGFDYDQIAPVVGVAEQDMENKKASYRDKVAEIGARIADRGKKSPGAAPGGVQEPKNKADFDSLPKGAHYRKPGDPPGTYRVKS